MIKQIVENLVEFLEICVKIKLRRVLK